MPLPHYAVAATALAALVAFSAPAHTHSELPDPDRSAARPLPDHDPDATSGGRSALEIAEDLGEANGVRLRQTLQTLAAMGPDALPARAAIRAVAEHGGGSAVRETMDEELRLGALAALIAIQAPEGPDLLREKILDPDYAERDSSYAGMLDGTAHIGVDSDTLIRDMIWLTGTAPEHAARLMTLDGLEPPIQSALEEAVFETAHGADATGHFLARLHGLDFLDDSAKVAYAADHLEIARDRNNTNPTRDALVGVGTDAALDLALALLADQGFAPYQTIVRFAQGPMPAETVADHLLAEALANDSELDIGRIASSIGSMLRDAGTSEAGPGIDTETQHVMYLDAMRTLIDAGPSDTHAIVGVRQTVRLLQSNDDVPLDIALDPIFDLFDQGGAGPAVHDAAERALAQSPGRLADHDPAYFIDRSVDLIWSGGTPAQANLPLHILTALIRAPEHAGLVVDTIAETIDPHRNDWTVNPAAAVVMAAGTVPTLAHTPVRETAGAVMGKAIANPALDLDYLGPHFARGGAGVAMLDGNTVEGVIAVFRPTIFATEKPSEYIFDMQSFMQPMMGQPAWLHRNPEALATWTAFLQRVIDLDDPDFSPTARAALDAL